MFCPSCGHESASDVRFCARCGRDLTAASGADSSGGAILPASRPAPALPGQRQAERSPALVVLFGFLTCGIYIIFWYFSALRELEEAGRPATGNSRWLDFLLAVITCGLWGLYVDYRMSKAIVELQEEHRVPRPNDTSVLVLVLDIIGLGLVGSAVHQSEMNRLWTQGSW